ncbi:MAG: DUF86 domain-containing protein [Xenococcus sp. (in: cyanobacteria)]
MNQDRDSAYIQHILDCIQQIKEYSKLGKDSFFTNMMLQDAILRRLQTMAESTQRLSEQTKEQMTEIDWRSISGFRNILVHDYLDGINLETVWQIIENYLPNLEKAIIKINGSKE